MVAANLLPYIMKFVENHACVNVRGGNSQNVISEPKIQKGPTAIAQVKSKSANRATPHAYSHLQNGTEQSRA